MRKKIMAFALMLVLLVVSGCFGGSSETLRCTLVEEEYGTTNTIDYKVEFSGDEVKAVELKMTMDFGDEEEAEMAYQFMGGMYEMFGEEDGVTVSSSLRGSEIVITMEMDVDKMDDSDFAEDFIGADFDEKITLEELKAELVAEGFTCN